MNFVPIEHYNNLFHYLIFLVVVFVFLRSFKTNLDESQNAKNNNFFGNFLFLIILLYIGLRPINAQFGDMVSYAKQFYLLQDGEVPIFKKDVLFEYMMYVFARYFSDTSFFFFCAFLYFFPLYLISKKLFKNYWFYSFLILTASLSFWSYGTNGIRNGLATSLFLLAICQNKLIFRILLLLATLFFHQSLYIPVFAYVLSIIYKNNKIYLLFWLSAIPLSLALGSNLENFFLNIGFGQKEDIQGYLGDFDELAEGVVLKVGFRWDFLIYSATAVVAGWFFIHKKKYKDLFYNQLVNVYLIANAFWILIIRANYSNRFAYLSWFMMGLIIIYPLLKVKFYNNQHQVIGGIILIYFLFTFLMNVVLL